MSDWPFRILKTPRLLLRPIEPGDADAYLDIFTDPETLTYWSSETVRSLDDAADMVAQDIAWVERGEALCWGIALPENDTLIGKISLYFFDRQNRRAETGYILNRSHWGRGLMSEALSTVMEYAFGELGLHRIEADVDPDHAASLALLHKFGFVDEGRFRDRWFVHEKWHDSIMLGLLAQDFRSSESQR